MELFLSLSLHSVCGVGWGGGLALISFGLFLRAVYLKAMIVLFLEGSSYCFS